MRERKNKKYIYAQNFILYLIYRMRSGQTMLKLECYAFKENESKEKIGHVLLNIRSAHLVYKYGNLNQKASWHKLIGLRNDLKTHKPELLLILRIEDCRNASSNAVLEVYYIFSYFIKIISKNLYNTV